MIKVLSRDFHFSSAQKISLSCFMKYGWLTIIIHLEFIRNKSEVYRSLMIWILQESLLRCLFYPGQFCASWQKCNFAILIFSMFLFFNCYTGLGLHWAFCAFESTQISELAELSGKSSGLDYLGVLVWSCCSLPLWGYHIGISWVFYAVAVLLVNQNC